MTKIELIQLVRLHKTNGNLVKAVEEVNNALTPEVFTCTIETEISGYNAVLHFITGDQYKVMAISNKK